MLINTQSRTGSIKTAINTPSPLKQPNLNKKPATDYQSQREDPILVDIEQTIGCPIQDPLMPFLEQLLVPAKLLSNHFRKKNKAVTKEQMITLFKSCGGLDETKNIKISQLVHYISEESQE